MSGSPCPKSVRFRTIQSLIADPDFLTLSIEKIGVTNAAEEDFDLHVVLQSDRVGGLCSMPGGDVALAAE